MARGDAFGERAAAFAGGIAVFKALLIVGYLREIRRPGLARLCTLYGASMVSRPRFLRSRFRSVT